VCGFVVLYEYDLKPTVTFGGTGDHWRTGGGTVPPLVLARMRFYYKKG